MSVFLVRRIPSTPSPSFPPMPAAVAAMNAGEWYQPPGTDLRQAEHSPGELSAGGWSGTSLSYMIDGWGSAAFDSKRYRLYLAGGGRASYSINAIFAFDLETLTWSRLFDGTPQTGISTNPYTLWWANSPPGPVPCHANDALQYSDRNGIDAFVRLGTRGPTDQSASNNQIFRYLLGSDSWSQDVVPTGTPDGPTAVHPTTGICWWVATNDSGFLHSYDPSTDVWTRHNGRASGPGQPNQGQGTAAIDPNENILVVLTAKGGTTPWMFDLDNPDTNMTVLSTTGDKTLESGSRHGVDFSTEAGVFVAHQSVTNGSDSDVYTLAVNKGAGTGAWTRVTATAGTPPASGSIYAGDYGRFRYVPGWDRFIFVNHVDANVAFYRL